MIKAKAVSLPNRACIKITGQDAVSFLQGLLTQDISKLSNDNLLYACLLTPQGKFLHDMFLRRDGDDILIDCEGGPRADHLFSHLKKYKIRSKVEIEHKGPIDVHQIWDSDQRLGYTDPRHTACGQRLYNSFPSCDLLGFEMWDHHRIRHEIPDGSRDLFPGKSFIHEARLDELNAVSYTKGCYVGQELVSRMHHRGLAKKHLKCVSLDSVPDGAELRSSCNDIGLALVKDA